MRIKKKKKKSFLRNREITSIKKPIPKSLVELVVAGEGERENWMEIAAARDAAALQLIYCCGILRVGQQEINKNLFSS